MSIKILIADDHQLTREGVRSMLEREDDITVLGEAEDGRSAVRLARELGPDVILMDGNYSGNPTMEPPLTGK